MAWALILAVALYPAQQKLARGMGGRQGLAATTLVLAGAVLIVLPTTVLMLSLGDSAHDFVVSVQDNTLRISAPREGVAEWPVVGRRAHALWSAAHADLPALIQAMQPKIGELSKMALGVVAGMLDNVLKPLMLGRGVDAPMPVILLGALGGMASGGMLGMFVGAVLLALGYQVFMGWVAANPDLPAPGPARESQAAD